jgi:hypothetical protein
MNIPSRKRQAIIACGGGIIVLLCALAICSDIWWRNKSNPVTELKGIMQDFRSLAEESSRNMYDGWNNYFLWDYDVKSNDSLAKPYVGTIRYRRQVNTGNADAECVVSLNYVDGRWVFAGYKRRFYLYASGWQDWTVEEVGDYGWRGVIKDFYSGRRKEQTHESR